MNEIICPHCSKAFKIDESGYADILKQVHDREFDKQLKERLELAEKEKKIALELAQVQASSEFQKDLTGKDAEIQSLKSNSRAVSLLLGLLSQKHSAQLKKREMH